VPVRPSGTKGRLTRSEPFLLRYEDPFLLRYSVASPRRHARQPSRQRRGEHSSHREKMCLFEQPYTSVFRKPSSTSRRSSARLSEHAEGKGAGLASLLRYAGT
jgi:hypothetical protein